jgi:hypothetical protein
VAADAVAHGQQGAAARPDPTTSSGSTRCCTAVWRRRRGAAAGVAGGEWSSGAGEVGLGLWEWGSGHLYTPREDLESLDPCDVRVVMNHA